MFPLTSLVFRCADAAIVIDFRHAFAAEPAADTIFFAVFAVSPRFRCQLFSRHICFRRFQRADIADAAPLLPPAARQRFSR